MLNSMKNVRTLAFYNMVLSLGGHSTYCTLSDVRLSVPCNQEWKAKFKFCLPVSSYGLNAQIIGGGDI